MSAEPPSPPQVSPDGKFYWDGTRWVPMPTTVAPQLPPVAEPAPSRQLSADGQYLWNGTQWVPNTQAPVVTQAAAVGAPAKKGHTLRNVGIVFGGLVALAVIANLVNGGGGSSSSNSNSSPSSQPAAVAANSPSPASTIAAPAPIVLSGAGSKVLPVSLANAPYRVSWTASGNDNMIVHILQGSSGEGLVNEIPPAPAAGQEFFASPGGNFIVEVQAATLTWTITFTEIVWPGNPNPRPKPAPISLSGQGSMVTNPMYIPAGNYKMSWTAQGHDNFIVHVEWQDGDSGLVNEIPPEPSSGETVFFSGGAEHFFVVQASTLTWTITLTPI